MADKAVIFGITGQDGSYLAEFLLSKGYEVHGVVRRVSTPSTSRISHLLGKISIHYGDVTDFSSIANVLSAVKPSEVYNLAAMSHVAISFSVPSSEYEITGLGAANVVEAVRLCCPEARVYQAGSSEMFGGGDKPQNESTPFNPRSPYACAKVFAFNVCKAYRQAYGMRIWNGILFNHESPRRGVDFVSRKIIQGVKAIAAGRQDKLFLGNLDAKRDWGYAPDYVWAMWKMMQGGVPDDFVVATGETHTVREFLEEAFSLAGLDWKDKVVIDESLKRPLEVHSLCGDYSKAKAAFGFEPKVKFKELVRVMHEVEI